MVVPHTVNLLKASNEYFYSGQCLGRIDIHTQCAMTGLNGFSLNS